MVFVLKRKGGSNQNAEILVATESRMKISAKSKKKGE